jgi:rRNA maturation RNase YbeY
MILIKNNIKKIKINKAKIKKDVANMLHLLHYQDFDIGIWFTTNKTIQTYNKQYRKKNKPTDILSFPYHTTLKPGKKIIAQSNADKNLGDIIISLEYCKKSAQALNTPLHTHLRILLAHGIAHLLGYTHDTEKNHKQMKNLESTLLKCLL